MLSFVRQPSHYPPEETARFRSVQNMEFPRSMDTEKYAYYGVEVGFIDPYFCVGKQSASASDCKITLQRNQSTSAPSGVSIRESMET